MVSLPYTLWGYTGHAGVRGIEIADKLARDGSVQRLVGPEPFLGVSRQNIRRKMKCWMENQHLVLWRVPCSIQRQARELISGPNLAIRARLLSFNGTQSMVVTGLLTGRNTLRRHLYIMGLIIAPLVGNVVLRRKPQSTFCLSVRPSLHSDIHICVRSFWTLKISGNLVEGPSGTLIMEQGSSNLVQNMGHKGHVLRSWCIGSGRARTQIPFNSIQFK